MLKVFFWVNHKKTKDQKLLKQASELKATNPDEAIRLLEKAHEIQVKQGTSGLETRLRIATVLYENRRFDEAEKVLTDEYLKARKWVIGKDEIAESERRYKERLRMGISAPYEKKREGAENPDFWRNLYCKSIYSKLRVCYEKQKKYAAALPYALAEAYAVYENRTHNIYCDAPQADFKAVIHCLKKLEMENDMPKIENVFSKYAKNPDSEKCWRMIDEVSSTFS